VLALIGVLMVIGGAVEQEQSSCAGNTTLNSYNGSISPQVGSKGGLSPKAQKALQDAIVNGATQSHVDPNYLAAIYYIENFQGGDTGGDVPSGTTKGDGNWKDLPPPYGNGEPYQNYESPTGAYGPFSFEPASWQTYGSGSLNNRLNIFDAAIAAGKLLAADGAANTTSETKLEGAAESYNGGTIRDAGVIAYGEDVYRVYLYLSGAKQSTVNGAPSFLLPSCSTLAADVTCAQSGKTIAGDAAILCMAEQYKGIQYSNDNYDYGGHSGYSIFRQGCPISSIASAASTSTPANVGPCATDCSGLVYVSLDQAFHLNYMGAVDNATGLMDGYTQDWKKIPFSQATSGDIVTSNDGAGSTTPGTDGHVEIVVKVQNGIVYTFGSHYTGTQTGPVSAPESAWNIGAWEWVGPGSGAAGSSTQ
jgi:hypothetical protein